ncbi:hypothetical protein [Pseudomonas marginalis]|jgi:hypothetical protein
MSFKLNSTRHKVEFIAVALAITLVLTAWLYYRKLPFADNQVYSMKSHVFWGAEAGATTKPHVENVETLKFHGRSFTYTSSWHSPDKLYYLNTYGKIYPIFGDLAYVKIEGKSVSDGFDDYLGGLQVRELFSRRLDLNVGQNSYVRFLKIDASGFCGYYYASDSVYCFAPEEITNRTSHH